MLGTQGPAETAGNTGGARRVTLSADDVRGLRLMLEGVMTVASHGILFRFGQSLGSAVVEEARARGGPVEAASLELLEGRGWLLSATALPAGVQVTGSIEADAGRSGGQPTCHILRGTLHRVLEASRGPHAVREVECASTGASACVFEIVEGARSA